MNAQTALRHAGAAAQAALKELAEIPNDVATWQAIANAGQIGTLIDAADHLRSAVADARAIAAAIDAQQAGIAALATPAAPAKPAAGHVQP